VERDGKVTYQIFDAPLLSMAFEERMEKLEEITSGLKHAFYVVQELVRDTEHLAEKLASVEADDGEGVMLRKKGSVYEFKRSNSILKVKSSHDAEAQVIGHEGGKGKHAGKWVLCCAFSRRVRSSRLERASRMPSESILPRWARPLPLATLK
jgi:ATP-dependent DNA ligase